MAAQVSQTLHQFVQTLRQRDDALLDRRLGFGSLGLALQDEKRHDLFLHVSDVFVRVDSTKA